MRKYKYIWLPVLLSVYFLFMTFYFGMDLLRQGETMRFWLTVGAELAVLVALVFFLKKREKLRTEREKDMTGSSRDRYKKL
ncbi:MAG: hypothetical protein K2N09_09080 [Muribaculaceae bacterium]|nr:hypothetical protein [Muribaculaceae bacterium]